MTTHRTSGDPVRRRAGVVGARAAGIAAGLLGGLIVVATVPAGDVVAAAVSQDDLVGQPYSRFGEMVVVLPNGNYVVTEPGFDQGTNSPDLDVGAVHLYSGTTHTAISTITGTTANDRVGEGGVTVLTNGNYVVSSPNWDNAGTADVGAVTWVNGTTGTSGPVTTGNSLYGILATTRVGSRGITALTNGNYVVSTAAAGTVTWANGTTGGAGPVTIGNSLHGTTFDDDVGSGGVTALTNGNYVVSSPKWDNAGIVDAGAATWGNGATGTIGPVTTVNSLHGTTVNNQVGSNGVTALTNGNYVVQSPTWDNAGSANAGAATWGGGATGVSGAVTTANSLHGTDVGHSVGFAVTALTNGNYVVGSPLWDNGATADVGATTWRNGATGIGGPVTTANSLHGTTSGDGVGSSGVIALANGNYVVATPSWDNGATPNVGATTWANGTTGRSGPVTTANSLHGTTADDVVGAASPSPGVTALTNGNYVVTSYRWDRGAIAGAGAATWANGTTGLTGPVTAANSLHGTTTGDAVGVGGVTALTNGNYVVASPDWNNGATAGVGAVTWGSGTTGITGTVTTGNSLHGTTALDAVGELIDGPGVTALTDGNYVVSSAWWNNNLAGAANAGAATWGSGVIGAVGPVSLSNSVSGSLSGSLEPSGWVGRASARPTPSGAIVIATTQNRVLVMSVVPGAPVALTAAAGDGQVSLAWTDPQDGAPVTGYRIESSLDGATWTVVFDDTGSTATTRVVTGLTNGTGYRFRVSARNVSSVGPPSNPIGPVIPAPLYVAVVPARLMESRSGAGLSTVDGRFSGGGVVGAGVTVELQVGGRGGVAADAAAVALNVTAVNAQDRGYLTVWPCGETRPNASSVNYGPGQTVPNAVISKMGTGGEVCVFTLAATNLVIDVNGFFPATSTFGPLIPARLLETRTAPGHVTVDGRFQGGDTIAAGTTVVLQIGGRGGVPADAAAAVLNVTAVNAQARGFLTVWACGDRPNASSVNYEPGQTVPNAVITELSADGTVCVFTLAGTHLLVDVNGFVPTGARFGPLTPARLLETRTGPGHVTADGLFQGSGTAAGGTTVELQIGGRGGVPSDATAAVLNVTAVNARARGFLTVWACGDRPNASSVNYDPGQTVPNAVIAEIDPTGKVCVFTFAGTDLLVDVTGFFP